jgi:putative restriction endonuclease
VKAVFTTKVGSGYKDRIEEHYHFPSTYLAQVENALGDMIVYYEPRRTFGDRAGGRQSYFAVAQVTAIERDPDLADHYYARVLNYLNFEQPVPFKAEDGSYFESMLQREDGGTSRGAFGRSVRNVPEQEFAVICKAGFAEPAADAVETAGRLPRFEAGEPGVEFERPVEELIVNRKFRDRAFARGIQTLYDRTCAVTGLRIINGGGRPEVQAAHIKPVAVDGPDSLRNGLALSSTVHWMFDRGLISVGEDFRLLTVDAGVPPELRRLFHPSGKIQVPVDPASQPLQHYLEYHRRNIFKGVA